MSSSTASSTRSGRRERRPHVDSARWLASLSPDAFEELIRSARPQDVKALWRGRLRHDREAFCRYCWPDRFTLGFSPLHKALFAGQDLPAWTERKAEHRSATAAPRGFAKSTIVSFAGIVHDIVFGNEAMIVLRTYQELLAGQRDGDEIWRDLKAQSQLGVTRGTWTEMA